MSFKFGGARAQVCPYCRFVVARSDRGLEKLGKMADLLELPTPFAVGSGGWWGTRRFEVEGRAQYNRVGEASAPWQETLVAFPEDGSHLWVAHAQGRWYGTSEVKLDLVPPFDALEPGERIELDGGHGSWVVQEIGARELLSAEGNLTGIPKPGVATRYADISASGGRFGTIDYGDGSEPPVVFLGSKFDPATVRLDSGASLEEPKAAAKELACPSCGGILPLLSERAERVVCKYCGAQSDVRDGALAALGPAPRPPEEPLIPIGAEGVLRGQKLVSCGVVHRSCVVDGERYPWREYLLWGGASVGYWWLMEEDGAWSLVTPIEAGEIEDAGVSVRYRGAGYSFKQQVEASVDYVVGEFYWQVAIGERVEATELEGPGGKVSREKSDSEVVYSFCAPFDPRELAAFGIRPPVGLAMSSRGFGGGDFDPDDYRVPRASWGLGSLFGVLLLGALGIGVLALMADCNGMGGGSYGGGYYSK